MSEELSAIIDDMPYNLGRAMELITQAAAEGRKKIIIQPTAATTLNRAIELLRREVDRIEAEPAPIKTTLNMHTDSIMTDALGKYAASTHMWVEPTSKHELAEQVKRVQGVQPDWAPFESPLTTRDPEPRGQSFGPGPATHVDGRDPMWNDNPESPAEGVRVTDHVSLETLNRLSGSDSWATPENPHNDQSPYEQVPEGATQADDANS